MRAKTAKVFSCCTVSQTTQLHLEQSNLVDLLLALLGFFPICTKMLSIINQYNFLASRIGANILMNAALEIMI